MIRTKIPSVEFNETGTKRHRNVAHLWADKQVIRFFRHNFQNKQHYKNLRSIYLALCEIDSDFGEGVEIRSFSQTVATYAGMDVVTVYPYLKALQKADLIDFWQKNENGRFGQTILKMYKWEEDNTKYDKMIAVLWKTRAREIPCTGNTVHGKIESINNTSKDVSFVKNSKESIFKKKINKKDFFLNQFPLDWKENNSFQEALLDFAEHRLQKNSSGLTEPAMKQAAKKLLKFPIQTAIIALNNSTAAGYTGIFPESVANGNNGKGKPKFTSAAGGTDKWAEQFNKREKQTINMQED